MRNWRVDDGVVSVLSIQIGMPLRSCSSDSSRAVYCPTNRKKIARENWYSSLKRGIVSDEKREPPLVRSMVRRVAWNETRIAGAGLRSTVALSASWLPFAASRKIAVAPYETLAVAVMKRHVGVVTR